MSVMKEEARTGLIGMADWGGSLPPELLPLIAKRIKSIKDFVAFGAVCTTWREIMLSKDSTKSLETVRWLMLVGRKNQHGLLQEEKEEDGLAAALLPRRRNKFISYNDKTREFYCLANDHKIYKIPLWAEETRGKKVLGTKGWLVTFSREHNISLFDPFLRSVIPLPLLSSFKRLFEQGKFPCQYITKAVLSSNPCDSSTGYILMVLQDYRLGFWKPGDKKWTVIRQNEAPYADIIYSKDQFYAVDRHGIIYLCDVRGLNPTIPVPLGRIPMNLAVPRHLYLAGFKTNDSSSMLLVARLHSYLVFDDYTSSFGPYGFKVYDVDLSGQEEDVVDTSYRGRGVYTEVNHLDGNTIFVGYNETICLHHSEFPSTGTIKSNCIYFTGDCCDYYVSRRSSHIWNCPHEIGNDIGIYNLEDGIIQQFDYL